MRKIACIFFPYFYAALARKVRPELKEHPLVIYREDKVVGFSPRLMNQALLGISLTKARGRCPEAVFTTLGHSLIQEAHERYLQILTGFSPVIEPLDEVECFIDLTGYKVERDIDRLQGSMQREGLGPCLVGIGGGKLTSRLAARTPFETGRKLPAFQVTDVKPGLEEEFLGPISLHLDWYLTPRILEKLSELGFKYFRDVQGLPLEEMVKILGRDGHMLYRHCRGLDDAHLIGLYPPQKLTCYFHFEGGTNDKLCLGLALREGAGVLGSALQKRRQGCHSISIDLTGEEGLYRAERMVVGGCQDERPLGEILKLLLDGTTIKEPVMGLKIQVYSLYDWMFSEQDMFSMNRKSTQTERDLAQVARLLQEKMPGKVVRGMEIGRREQVLALWDPWRSCNPC